VQPVTGAVAAVLGEDTLADLRGVWQAAQVVADDDGDAMIELGRRWCAILSVDPGTDPDGGPTTGDPHPGSPTTGGSADPGTSGPQPGGPPQPDPITEPLVDALTDAIGRITSAVASETPPAPAVARSVSVPSRAQTVAATVFDGPTSVTGRVAVSGTRPPTGEERRAARQLGAAVTTAGVRDRVATKTTSALPPGRLRMRGALTADAQRAAGAIPTAEPFTRVTRTTVAAPPLRLGVACDVSGSMSDFTGPVASAAWILAHAARHTQVPATTATVIFGQSVHPITHPGAVPARVTTFRAVDREHALDDAIDALDATLDLSVTGAARLLVIVSDGIYEPTRRTPAQARVTALRRTGCGVLWLAPAGVNIQPLDGPTVHTLGDPSATATAIARAATVALRAAR